MKPKQFKLPVDPAENLHGPQLQQRGSTSCDQGTRSNGGGGEDWGACNEGPGFIAGQVGLVISNPFVLTVQSS